MVGEQGNASSLSWELANGQASSLSWELANGH
jgi:hypothetical protein